MALDGRNTLTIFDFSDAEGESASVIGLRMLPNGPTFVFEDYRIENQLKRVLVIGADPGCDIILEDPSVSGLHCLIERHPQHLLVHDCQSKNGTRVNGALVKVGELRLGTLLTVGCTTMVVYGNNTNAEHVLIAASSFRDFLRNAVSAYGSVRGAAEAIGLPYSTLRGWLKSKLTQEPGATGAGGQRDVRTLSGPESGPESGLESGPEQAELDEPSEPGESEPNDGELNESEPGERDERET